MLSIGCIQAQKCHTDRCPTGVATQDPWLAHGLDPTLKSTRLANYVKTLRRDLLKVSEACGVAHPGLIDADDIEILYAQRSAVPLREVYGYQPGWGAVTGANREILEAMMSDRGHGGSASSSATAQR
jgi:hypothetical protein